MATYNFHGGNQEMETTDGLHTLYLMNPNYSTSHHHHHQQAATTTRQNMILLNSSLPHALSHSHVSHAPPQPQSQFLTIPFAHPISADDPNRSGNSFHYNLWGSGGGGGGGGQVVEVSSGALGVSAAATHPYQIQLDNNDTDMFRRPAVVSPTINQQGLSLSLSSQPRLGGGSTTGGGNNGNSYNNSSMSITVVNGSSSGGGGGGGFGSTSSAAQADQDSNGVHNLIMGSKYLKAAQELLDEVVNVGKGSAATTTTIITANDTVKKEKEKVAAMQQMDNNNNNINGESEAAGNNNEAAAHAGGGGSNRAASSELTVTQRQELQMKKTKLINMLDEVEQTYRQYNHQMKTVVSSFEQVAGLGSARSYTSLALTTISKQFRCLKDAIMSQIKQISKSLGEEPGEDCLGVKAEGSRLRMIDHQLRQQRALQQLGMIQHNAWRPQRGLPERAVSVLRAWLFEHFLHPYPKDSDKHILAKRTGLTRNQVSNWFINARVRLWKPMVEEMYLEEVKDQPATEQNGSNSNQDNNNGLVVTIAKSSPADHKQQQTASNQNADHISNSTTMSTSPNNNASSFHALGPPHPGFTLASSDMDGIVQYKKPRGATVQETTQNNSPSSILSAGGEMSFSRQDQSSNLTAKFGAYSTGYDNNNNNGGGFGGAYHQFGDQVGSRFNPDEQLFHHGNNNGSVSLTLGLPPGENLAHNNYFSGHGYQMGGNVADGTDDFCGTNNPQNSNMGFQNMDIQNRKNYAAQLLPDFVA